MTITNLPNAVDQVREKALAGQKVTADQLAKARAADDLAALEAEAARTAADRDAEARRLADIDALMLECEEFRVRDLAALAETYRAYVEAGRMLQKQIAQHNKRHISLRHRARRLGVGDEADCGRELSKSMLMSRAGRLVEHVRAPIKDPALPLRAPAPESEPGQG